MQINGLNHVNIVTGDVEGTVRFYEQLLGLRSGERPGLAAQYPGAWLYDDTNRPIIHLGSRDPVQHGAEGSTGAIDHVAFTCQDYDEALRRCEAMGVPHRTNDIRSMNFRQIIVADPNNVTLELNFADG